MGVAGIGGEAMGVRVKVGIGVGELRGRGEGVGCESGVRVVQAARKIVIIKIKIP